MAETATLIKGLNRFEEDFQGATEEEKERIIGVLREFMSEVRGSLDRSVHFAKKLAPELCEQCHTCAFNPITDHVKGFGPTAYGLLVTMIEDRAFVCHENQREWKERLINPDTAKLCRGFQSVRLFSGTEASHSAIKAMCAIHEIFPPRRQA